jgi:diaphanous 1
VQLDVYTEEKSEDDEDLRERAESLMKRDVNHRQSISESDIAYETLMEIAKRDDAVYSIIVDIIKQYTKILDSTMNKCVTLMPHVVEYSS